VKALAGRPVMAAPQAPGADVPRGRGPAPLCKRLRGRARHGRRAMAFGACP